MNLSYNETIKHLFALLPMYQRSGTKALKKDLTNIKRLCASLDQPQNDYNTIHVAGTNGKGTVTHLLAAIMQSMGYKVGIYTSPHYVNFRERIKVNGELTPESYVIDWVSENDELIKNVRPSFFEATVAMAFDYFKTQKIDLAIIETGLGGRLDSTNIINPELSVITHISLDHQAILGNSIYEIAGEKAGIIKHKVPVVIGRYQSNCDQVFIQKASCKKASISWASINWGSNAGNNKRHFCTKGLNISIDWPDHESPLLQENIITSLEATRCFLKKEEITWDRKLIQTGIENFRSRTNYIGRWQILEENPTIIADSAHNEDAIRKVLQKLSALKKKIHFVIGLVKDKDIIKVLSLFPKDAHYYFVNATIERALPSDELMHIGAQIGLIGKNYETVQAGIAAAKIQAKPDELIYVGGSSFVVGDSLQQVR